MTAAVMTMTIMTTTVGRGTAVAVLKTEPAAAAAEVAEAAAVAMARTDTNQQRAANTVAAAIAVGNRHQAREVVGAGVAAAMVAAMAGGERPEVRVEFGVPYILLGNYLAQSRAMFLVNAYLERSRCLASRQTFICAADRFICLRR